MYLVPWNQRSFLKRGAHPPSGELTVSLKSPACNEMHRDGNSIFQVRARQKEQTAGGMVSLKVSLDLRGIKSKEKREPRTIFLVCI